MRLLSTFGLALTGFLAITTSFSTSVYAANLYGTNNSETIYGTASADTIVAYAGNDTVYGGAGNDVIYGNAGSDVLIGDQGADSFYGGADADTVYSYAGDTIRGEGGIDTIYLQRADHDACSSPRYGTGGSVVGYNCYTTIYASNTDGSFDRINTGLYGFTITRPGTYSRFVGWGGHGNMYYYYVY